METNENKFEKIFDRAKQVDMRQEESNKVDARLKAQIAANPIPTAPAATASIASMSKVLGLVLGALLVAGGIYLVTGSSEPVLEDGPVEEKTQEEIEKEVEEQKENNPIVATSTNKTTPPISPSPNATPTASTTTATTTNTDVTEDDGTTVWPYPGVYTGTGSNPTSTTP